MYYKTALCRFCKQPLAPKRHVFAINSHMSLHDLHDLQDEIAVFNLWREICTNWSRILEMYRSMHLETGILYQSQMGFTCFKGIKKSYFANLHPLLFILSQESKKKKKKHFYQRSSNKSKWEITFKKDLNWYPFYFQPIPFEPMSLVHFFHAVYLTFWDRQPFTFRITQFPFRIFFLFFVLYKQ